MIGIYSRQSLEKKESISIESQIEFCKREIFNEEFKVYTDSGYSGKNIKRPAFQSMMKDIKNGKINKIVVYRLDRISRSLVDFADFMEVLEENKSAFVSATEKIDTSTPMGRAMLYIVVIFAQLERETIASRVQDNYFSRVSDGAWGGGLPPLGFELKKNIINGKNASTLSSVDDIAIIQKIFDLYGNQNLSLSQIQKEFPNNKFTSSKLSKILKNPVYTQNDFDIFNYYNNLNIKINNSIEEFTGTSSCYLIGRNNKKENNEKILTLAPHKGVIKSELFLKCQEKLRLNKNIKNKGKGKHTWLSGIVKCGYCGYSFSVRIAKTLDGDTKYFSCSGKYIHNCCNKKQTHRVLEVEKIVEKEILKKLSDFKIPIKYEKNIKSILENEKEIIKINNEIEYFISELKTDDSIIKYYIQEKINKLHYKKMELSKKKIILDNENNNDSKNIMFSYDNWLNLSFEKRSILVKELISKIELKDGNIKIYFNI